MTTKVQIGEVTMEATGEWEETLIARAFEFLAAKGVEVPTLSVVIRQGQGEAASEAGVGAKESRRDIDRAIEEFARQPRRSRSRVYPKVGPDGKVLDGPTRGATIAERLAASGDVPEYWVTGIKTDEDGTKRYKTFYHCPVCGDKGRHYVHEGAETCKCRQCGAELKLAWANPNGYLERDPFGNYFVANALAELKKADDVSQEQSSVGEETESAAAGA
ncbi:MAG: hypothetical protein IRZ33_06050 [Alicyclobacillaceae bacterium]|nr:hypothetical protein [Alicyclobacillaceae bacterium]